MGHHADHRPTVLHIFSGDLWAGAEVMICNLIDQLREDRKVRIMALSLNEGTLTGKLRDMGIETHVIPESDHSFPLICVKAFTILRGKQIDIVHSHRYKENLLGMLFAKATKVGGLVTTIHGLSEPLMPNKYEIRDHIKTTMDYRLLNRYFHRVVAVSEDVKRTLVQEYSFRPEVIRVIYNGVPLPDTSPAISHHASSQFHVGTVGRLVPVKDINLFLEIAAEISRRTDTVRFSILGDGPQKEQLIERARALNIQDRILFASPVPNPRAYYESLDLYLNTSIHEGIPLSILDAMACGKPVVAPSVGGIPEIIAHGEDGWLVSSRRPKDFADSCLKILQDNSMRISMGEYAFKKVSSRFSACKMAEAYRELYLSLCPKCSF